MAFANDIKNQLLANAFGLKPEATPDITDEALTDIIRTQAGLNRATLVKEVTQLRSEGVLEKDIIFIYTGKYPADA